MSSRTSLAAGNDQPPFPHLDLACREPLLQPVDVDGDIGGDRMPRRQVLRLHLSAARRAVELQDADPLGIGGEGVVALDQRRVDLPGVAVVLLARGGQRRVAAVAAPHLLVQIQVEVLGETQSRRHCASSRAERARRSAASPRSSTSSTQPGGTRQVMLPPAARAGPSTRLPGASPAQSCTGTRVLPPSASSNVRCVGSVLLPPVRGGGWHVCKRRRTRTRTTSTWVAPSRPASACPASPARTVRRPSPSCTSSSV